MSNAAPLPYTRLWVLLGAEAEGDDPEAFQVLAVTTDINAAFRHSLTSKDTTSVVEVWLAPAGEAGLLALGLSFVEEVVEYLHLSGAEQEIVDMAGESLRKMRTLTATALQGEVSE